MTTFYFRAKNLSGRELEGRREAQDLYDLASSLRKEGYFLLGHDEDKTKLAFLKLVSMFGRVSAQEKMVFARNLAVMTGAGVSLVKSLDVLSRQTDNVSWRHTLENMGQAVKRGRNLSQSMEEYPKIFSPLFRAMVKAGEASGNLEETLRLTAQQLERDYDLRRKVRGAFVYPTIILIAMVAIGILMMVYVVPTLLATFEELEVELPLSTKVIIAISSFLLNRWLLASGLAVSFFTLIFLFLTSKTGKKLLDEIFLKTPVISGLTKKINAARVSRTLSSLVSSGVDIVEALKITEEVVQNYRFKRVLGVAREEIQKGSPVSRVFIENKNLFPLLVGEMMSVGEETGKFSDMLLKVASFYEEDVSESTKALSTIIEPVLMIIIGAVVGLFAVSMIQPLYSLTSGI